jgi:ElaA protein
VVHRSWGELSTRELYSILKLRTDVFFVEQRIDEEELDNRDIEPTTEHLWIADDAGIAAYLRVLYDAEATGERPRRSFGRVVVRADRRGEGLARVLVARVIELYGGEAMELHSQRYVTSLYATFGFEEVGDVYVEAGIPHISMYRAGRGRS